MRSQKDSKSTEPSVKTLLVIMAKAPIPGEVKTRLTPAISPADAAKLSACFLEDRLAEMGKLDSCERALAFTPESSKSFFEKLAKGRFSLLPQKGMDLGERMSNVFKEKHRLGYGGVVLIGSDSPDLPNSIVSEAFDRLLSETVDVVLGPATDGGYYLIGMKRHHPELFENISWGTEKVLSTTLETARQSAVRTACLETWSDIDTIQDIRRFHHRYKDLPASEHRPGAITLSCLADLKIMGKTRCFPD